MSDPKSATYYLAQKMFGDDLLTANLSGNICKTSNDGSKDRQQLDPKKIGAIESRKRKFFNSKINVQLSIN